MSGKVLVMRAAWGWGKGVSLTAKKRREAKGREVAGFKGSPLDGRLRLLLPSFLLSPGTGRSRQPERR